MKSPKIEQLKRKKFTVSGKKERVRKALAALSERQHINLTPQEWRRVAETKSQ